MPSAILPKMGHKSVWFHRAKSYKLVAPVKLPLVQDLTLVPLPLPICKFAFCRKSPKNTPVKGINNIQSPKNERCPCAIVQNRDFTGVRWGKVDPAANNLGSWCSFQLNSASQRPPRKFKLCAVCYVAGHVTQVHKHPFVQQALLRCADAVCAELVEL